MDTTKTRTFTATCHCKHSTLSFTVPTSSLPLPTHFCHCSICRHTHGTLATVHTLVPSPEVDLSENGSFKAYKSSKDVTRFFCKTCGAHMLDRVQKQDDTGETEKWVIAAALVDADEDVWLIRSHFNVESTRDGGLATWIRDIDEGSLKLWSGNRDSSPWEFKGTMDWQSSVSGPVEGQERQDSFEDSNSSKNPDDEKLRARCYCGGVDFSISRPRDASVFDDIPASLTPKDKSKWYALNDTCNSCRLVSAVPVVSWSFPAVSHITLTDGSPYPQDHLFGTLRKYESSEGVVRTFCGVCGAMVVYACAGRSEMVDVAVGLLESQTGVKAEDWLEWRTEKVGFEEDCKWKGFLKGLKHGLKNWEEERS